MIVMKCPGPPVMALFVAIFSLLSVCLNMVLGQEGLPNFGANYVCENFPDYTAYINQWKEDNPQEARTLYPFGTTYCDTMGQELGRVYGFDPNIRFDVPFYGKLYKSLWVSPCGFIALDQGTSAKPVPFDWVSQWPNPQYPLEGTIDPPFIAPFYSEADLFRSTDPSEINYRILDPRYAGSTLQRIVMEGMLNQMSLDVRGAVLGTDDFQASYGIIVTWYKVTFAANDCSGNNNDCARNTYQAAIVTDGEDTFAIFSYYDMKWVGGGGEQNCDRMTGTTTSSAPSCEPGHIGFNAGEGRGFHPLPQSGENSITDIDTSGGSNVTGRFYYHVSGDYIVRGGCANNLDLAGPRWQAEIFPRSGGMLGGTEVQISGPCFNNPDHIKCRYDGVDTEALYFDNSMRVTCVAPMMYKVGTVKVGVSVDGGNNFRFETDYIIVTQDHITPEVRIERQRDDWVNPEQFELLWSPDDLTSNQEQRVNIKLYGYREDSSSGNLQGIWEELHVLAQGYSNTGVFLFQADTFQCDFNEEGQLCTTFDLGAFQVSIEYPTDDPANPRRVWSRIIPLAWYIKNAMSQAEGSDWINDKCEVWYYENNEQTAWINELGPCPCTFNQVYTDFGRFQPDPLCRQGGTDDFNCERHKGAKHCAISIRAGNSGSGNQCCYDDRDELMYSGDTMYGSRPQRSHVWGAVPYQVPPRIPKLSHWVSDVMGFYYCCEWQNSPKECHSKYLALRSTKNCQNYQTSGQAAAFGDPHFKTYDGVFYTFNGYGEYWLMQVLGATVNGENINFKLQGRLQQPDKQPWGYTNASYVTAVGMQLNDKHKIVFEVNKGGIRKKILVHIDNYLLDLTKYDLRRQEFTDMIIMNNDPISDEQATNFTAAYRCGIAVNVFWKNDLLDLTVSAPPEFKHVSRGLLGKWNDDASDDLEPKRPGGPPFRPDETEKVHNLFGETWRATASESCFTYLYQSPELDYEYYNRPNFIPNFVPTFPSNNTGITDEMVRQVCQNDLGCTFDYKATLDDSVGRDTKLMQEWDQQRREMGIVVYSCPWLPVPYSIKREPVSYLVGSQVTITGCVEGYTLEGPTVYTCQNSGDGPGRWTPDVTTRCRGPDDPLPSTTVLAIAIPVALAAVLIIIAIVVIILVVRKKQKKKRQAKESKQALHDFMGGNADSFTVVPPAPGKKPPRPDILKDQTSFDDTLDAKHEYENKMLNDTPTTVSSGNHVSWDTQDGDKLSDNTKPLKQSTLKSQKKNVSKEESPPPSPKRKRPYQYPTQSRDNSLEDWRSNESPTLKIRSGPVPEQQEPSASYKPRDTHSYSKGHSIPTANTNVSNYYKRKYGRYNNSPYN